MNAITKFFHELFTPHCQHCADERRLEREENKYCASCETLASENARLVRENERLLDSLLEKPVVESEKKINLEELKPINTSRTPFMPSAVRRQMLEKETRHTAQLLKDAPKPDALNKDVELQELEAELKNVRQERETQSA